MPVIDGREWSDGKLVISVVGSSEYLDIFIPIFFPFLRWHRGALGYFLLPKLLWPQEAGLLYPSLFCPASLHVPFKIAQIVKMIFVYFFSRFRFPLFQPIFLLIFFCFTISAVAGWRTHHFNGSCFPFFCYRGWFLLVFREEFGWTLVLSQVHFLALLMVGTLLVANSNWAAHFFFF